MKRKVIFYFNAPITLTFSAICILALILQAVTAGVSTDLIFSTYSSSLLDPLTYVRIICHIFGHSDITHLAGNLMYILLLGPMLEEKYHERLIGVILTTALVTGIVHNLFFPETALLGASGVVFAFILLSSITGSNNGIPITMILVAILWLGEEIYDGITIIDNVSHLTHILGGLTGMGFGLIARRR